MSPPNSQVEAVISNVIIFGDRVFGGQLRFNEVIYVET